MYIPSRKTINIATSESPGIVMPDGTTISVDNDGTIHGSSGGVATSVIGTEETGSTASKNYSAGEYFVKDDRYCKAISSITSGTALTKNTNYVESSIENEMSKHRCIPMSNALAFPKDWLDAWVCVATEDRNLMVSQQLTNVFAPLIDESKININTRIYAYYGREDTGFIVYSNLIYARSEYYGSIINGRRYYYFNNGGGNYTGAFVISIVFSDPSYPYSPQVGDVYFNSKSGTENAYTVFGLPSYNYITWFGIKY